MKKKQWKKKYKKLYKKYLILNQHSLQYCSGCAWNAIIPGIGCLNCQHWEREQKKKVEENPLTIQNEEGTLRG